MARACAPAPTSERSARCSATASGVVRSAPLIGVSGKPLPMVPMTAQRMPSRDSSCAIHWLHEVLPLVPVTPIASSDSLGWP